MYVCTCVHVTHIYVAIVRKKAINLKGGQEGTWEELDDGT